jgi:hypothetical protein
MPKRLDRKLKVNMQYQQNAECKIGVGKNGTPKGESAEGNEVDTAPVEGPAIGTGAFTGTVPENSERSRAETEKMCTTEEAAQFLNLSADTLKKWRRENRGPEYVRYESTVVRYPRSKLNEYVRKSVVRPAKKTHLKSAPKEVA